ncbi:MAG: uracil phosphoribosyltransferase [Lutibacter sp.]|nr:uracil phosphoribosyltransferase [Lutibacter sp.]
MKVTILEKEPSVLNTFISEIRNRAVQQDPMRFRKNIERIGEILAYEISRCFEYRTQTVSTPLGTKDMPLPNNKVVICSILRAGLPLHNGLLDYFDGAENAFIAAGRKHLSETEFEIETGYYAAPNLEGKTLILADPMLATGQSIVAVLEGLKKYGTPKEIHLACVIGATEGIQYVEKHFPKNTRLWIAAVDEKLNNKGYIIPGLGDAGDLAYGTKQ